MNQEEQKRYRELRKEMMQHLQNAAELALQLDQAQKLGERWLDHCVQSWNIAVEETGMQTVMEDYWLREKQAAAQIKHIDWRQVDEDRAKALAEEEDEEEEQ
jgi:hypothetical protein